MAVSLKGRQGKHPNAIKRLKTDNIMNKLNDVTAVRNFVYFASNFYPGFVWEVWKDDPHLYAHLAEKWAVYCKKDGYGSVEAFFTFFYNLSEDNQYKLIRWVYSHYRA